MILKPTISMIPMEDIAAELRSEKAGRKFLTKTDKAIDVVNVGDIPASNIAIAESKDRKTVRNALNLCGVPGEQYLTKTEGEKLINIADVISKTYSSEIQNLRDELYQMKSSLNKDGFMEISTEYEGFVDTFKNYNKKYEEFICGISTPIIGSTEELYISDLSKIRFFEADKKFIIRRDDLDVEIVVTSTGVSNSGRVTFHPSTNLLENMDTVRLLKSNGVYVNNSYSFSSIEENVANSLKERYHTQSDDTATSILTITNSNEGFATVFKVPNSSAGALSKFGIRASAVGTPGSLICHILDINALSYIEKDSSLICNFKNIQEAKEKGYLIASSDSISSNDVAFDNEKEIYFNFYNTSSNSYPIIEGKRYIFVIQCLNANNSEYWKIRFSHYNNNGEISDLQKYNKSYIFKNLFDSGLATQEQAIQESLLTENRDLIFTLVTKELVEQDEIGKSEGIYTAKIVLPEPIDVSRVRLTTKINKEGLFYVDSYNSNNTIFTLAKEFNSSYSENDPRFIEGQTVIIGNKIARIKRVTGNRIETMEPVYLDQRIHSFYTKTIYNNETGEYEEVIRIPVYRMNYQPKIKASFIDWETWNEETNEFNTIDKTGLLDLDLKQVIPNGKRNYRKKIDHRVSDRLIFETKFNTDNTSSIYANEFELQIYWKSSFNSEEINAFKDTADNEFKELIGRIFDLIVTFDKNY